MKHDINLTVNGELYNISVQSHHTLLQVLRDQLVLTGTKNGCSEGECGACTVLLDGEPVNSCLVLGVEAGGHEITTVEGLATDGHLAPIQQTIVDLGGTQCGFCTPGILIAAQALLQRNPDPSEREIREGLVGNLCRCTGYVRIIDAVREAGRLQRKRVTSDRVIVMTSSESGVRNLRIHIHHAPITFIRSPLPSVTFTARNKPWQSKKQPSSANPSPVWRATPR